MKKDLRLIISLLQNIRFKITIMIMCLLTFMSLGTITNKMTMVEGIYNVMTWEYFIMILLFLFLFNTYNIYTEITKNYFFLIRVKNNKEFFNKISKFIFISNLIIYLIIIILVIISAVLKTGMNLEIDNYKIYNISNLLYLIFHIIRSYFILNMINIILISIYKLIKEELTLLIAGILPLSIVITSPFIIPKRINTVFKLPLYYGEYFIQNNYGSFTFEICMSILFISILLLITKTLIEISSKRKVDIAN